MKEVNPIKLKPKARQYARQVRQLARMRQMALAKQQKVSDELRMLNELTTGMDNMLNRAIQEAPKDLIYELEGQDVAGAV